VCAYASMYTSMPLCQHVNKYMSVHLCMYVRVYVHDILRVYLRVYVCMDVRTYVRACVCMDGCTYVCIYQHSPWFVFQLSRRATRTLDISIAVAFMLTLKMDEEALDRCIEKTLWCKLQYCEQKTTCQSCLCNMYTHMNYIKNPICTHIQT